MSTGRGQRDGFGLVVLAVGTGIVAVASGVWPDALQGLNAPAWVLLAAGAVFVLAGAMLLAQERMPAWVQGLLGNILLSLFAAIPAWIAWGGNRHGFSSALGIAGMGFGVDGAAIGRLAFAGAALLMGLIALFAWAAWLTQRTWSGRGYFLCGALLVAHLMLVTLPAEPRWPELVDDHARLARYALLAEDEGWNRIRGGAPRRWIFPPWRNLEDWTKAARDRLAAARAAPAGIEPLELPLLAAPPRIDGRIEAEEWRGARRLELTAPARGSTLLLAADARHLYLAAEVPADTTAGGFDQFRFWFHIGLSPWLDNERAFLDRSGQVTVLRTTRFPWGDNPPRQRSDWRIYERARGATTLDGHRRYEMALDLAEAGIAPGVPFPAWLEVEGDPLRDAAGKFKARTDLGRAGSHATPLWLRVAAR